ncbi:MULTISPECIES: DUF6364 family protein [Gammaproteobacteria]|uniref:DUF6364 family protein n=1 Tax=Gammaproteobacteria TaxID=1236 RepID=UPI001ADC6580|nr:MULTISPECIES: DUF6364 family protein [Gammaproteobacteria]MBO9480495.1 hypothetical protein [Salinisphaera sp. G21_0]MBO9494790.1 hypothetical protein [Thalassotalea sp. G20_0]
MHKLTLRVENELVNNAKKYAAQHGKSLSQLVADYFADLTRHGTEDEPLPPLTQSLKGLLADGPTDDAEKDYKKHLEDKYL